jgi:hypothetical protein
MILLRCSHAKSARHLERALAWARLWQIVEKLGWFKEAEKLKPGAAPEQQVNEEVAVMEPTSEQEQELVYDERRRRPRVYRTLRPWRFGRFHFVSSLSPPFTLNKRALHRRFDAVVPEMRPHICQLTEVLLIPMAVLPLHRRYLATLVRLGNRPRSTSRHSEHKNYVRSSFYAFPTPRCFVQYPF